MASPAEMAFSSTMVVQQALNMLTYNLFAYLNPYDGCIYNNSAVDYIIVGGGTSGCVLANRLSAEKSNIVLLIEAGGDFDGPNGLPFLLLYNANSRRDWNYTSIDDGYTNQCHRSKTFTPLLGHVLGGTSSTDFMFYSQGYMEDYEAWADITGEEAWRFDNVQRLFKKVENFQDPYLPASDRKYHGFNGNLNITKDDLPETDRYLQAFTNSGKIVEDINNGTRLGYTKAVYYIHTTGRQNSPIAYLYPVRDRKNLIVVKNMLVTKIRISNRRAVGVEAINTKTNKKFVFRCRKEVIVAAGSLNTPKLLQLSGVGPRRVLQKFGINVIADLPVGRNYQNHVSVVLNFSTKKTNQKNVAQNIRPTFFPSSTFWGYVALNRSEKLIPDYKASLFIVTSGTPTILLQYTSTTYKYQFNISNCLFKKNIGRELMFSRVESLQPKSRGVVEISSKDPFAKPYFDAGFFADKQDLKDMVEYVKDFFRVMDSDYFKEIGAAFSDGTKRSCGQHKFGTDEYWECYILCMMSGLDDNAGTAAMGMVTDGRMRVYGICSLRVVDASAMPVLVRGSVTVPTMMMAENAAEMILEDDHMRNYRK